MEGMPEFHSARIIRYGRNLRITFFFQQGEKVFDCTVPVPAKDIERLLKVMIGSIDIPKEDP